jgi:hypothetical protein
MLKDEQHDPPTFDRGFMATCASLVLATACSIVVLAAPRPVQPRQLPALRLSRSEVAAQLATDHALAARAPRSRALERFRELFSEEGLAEREKSVDLGILSEQRAQLKALVASEFPRLGGENVRALMAALTDEALPHSFAKRPPAAAYGLLGRFPALLTRYGYADAEGHLIAPELAVRALYKARFNLITERPLDTDLSPVERQAQHGWNALHAGELPPERRARAARDFAASGGTDAREALAIWLFQGGDHAHARELLQAEYERTGALRLRNLLLFIARQG